MKYYTEKFLKIKVKSYIDIFLVNDDIVDEVL